MNRPVTLTNFEATTLEHVLEYIVEQDDRERLDFVSRVAEHLECSMHDRRIDTLFNEHDVLVLDAVPTECKQHVFYKASFLLQELRSQTYGN